MNDALRRALRTFLQGFVGVLALIAIPALNNLVSAVAGGGEVEFDVNFWQGVAVAAVAGGIIALVSWAQNEIEDTSGKAVLKEPVPKETKGTGTV